MPLKSQDREPGVDNGLRTMVKAAILYDFQVVSELVQALVMGGIYADTVGGELLP